MPSKLRRRLRHSNYRVFIDKWLWLAAWRSVKRAHKDKRARKHLLLVSAAILVLALVLTACVLYLFFIIGSGAWLFLPFVIPVSWWIRRGARREFTPMNITPKPEPLKLKSNPNESSSLVAYFAKLALLYAVLADRAVSEGYLKQKELPEGAEVLTRRTHLELLKSVGVWDNLKPQDREAIMMTDGDWDWERIEKEALCIEPICALRWILRLDYSLPFIALQISTDFSIAHDLVANPRAILDATDLVEIEAVSSAREQANMVLLRCLAESISRGYIVPENQEMIAWAKGISVSLGGDQDEDILIGDQLVSEVSESQLARTLSIARIRHDFLSWVEALMNSQLDIPESFESRFVELSSDT